MADIQIAIVAVPARAAQAVVNTLVQLKYQGHP